jgi:rod shape-determining protein MreC
MENLLTRYRNISILVGVLFLQVLGLAIQVKRNTENESSRLIRVWTVAAVTPLEKGIVGLQNGVSGVWHNYLYLRGIRQENRNLQQEIQQLRLQQVRLSEDAAQAHRLQALLGFKEQFIAQTLAAQVIGTSGSEESRSVYIDKGEHNGIKRDMPVITADGIVGKVLRVYGSTAEILLISDQSSGAGAITEKSRLKGIVQGTPSGDLLLQKIMSDEQVQVGDKLLTSGGDGIFPKGMPLGTVLSISKGKDSLLSVRVKPAANLNHLEEVLVITQQEQRAPATADSTSSRAADILAQELPSVPDKPGSDKSASEKPVPGQKAPKINIAIADQAAGKPKTKPQTVPAGTPQSKPNAEPVADNAATAGQKPVSHVVKVSDQPERALPATPAAPQAPQSSPGSLPASTGGQPQ